MPIEPVDPVVIRSDVPHEGTRRAGRFLGVLLIGACLAACAGSVEAGGTVSSAEGASGATGGEVAAPPRPVPEPNTPPPRPAPVPTPPGPAVTPPTSTVVPSTTPTASGSNAPFSAGVRYYVRVGALNALVARLGEPALAPSRAHLLASIAAVQGVAVAPSGESRDASAARLRAHPLPGAMLECSIVRVDAGPQGTRAAVSIVVAELESANIVATLQGGALAPGQTGDAADRAAIAGALDAALRGLPRVLDTMALR